MKPLVIALSGINATENPGPGLAIARSLKEGLKDQGGVKIVGLSYDPNDPGHYLKEWIDQSYILPFPTKGWAAVSGRLKEIQEQTKFDLMIPNLDAELPLLIKYTNESKILGINTYLPTEEQFDLRSKAELKDLAEANGCEYPKTYAYYSLQELFKIVPEKLGFPVFVKGNYYKAYKVYNHISAAEKSAEISSEWGFPLLAQQIIEGTEVNLVGLGDGQGNLCGCVCIKKQTTTSLGKVWTALTIKDDKMVELALGFCKKTKWRGPFELEAIRNKEKIFLIEINPRFPAWVYFATALGVNLPLRLVDLSLKGACPMDLRYPVGKHLIRHTHESLGDMETYLELATTGQHGETP